MEFSGLLLAIGLLCHVTFSAPVASPRSETKDEVDDCYWSTLETSTETIEIEISKDNPRSEVFEELASQAINATIDALKAKDLRIYLAIVWLAAEKTLQAMEGFKNLTDDELMTFAEDLLNGNLMFVACDADAIWHSVSDVQDFLCPAIEKESYDFREWIRNGLEEVLGSVGFLLRENVTMEEVEKMYFIVQFMDRYHSELERDEEFADIELTETLKKLSELWKELDRKMNADSFDVHGSKTVKKMLFPL